MKFLMRIIMKVLSQIEDYTMESDISTMGFSDCRPGQDEGDTASVILRSNILYIINIRA